MTLLKLSTILATTIVISACGTLTGIPSHGGGKRFAVEQELVASSSRAALKELDLSALQDKKVALYISTMGDQGSGNMTGGRYSLSGLIRGEYLSNPLSQTSYAYPEYTTTANTSSGSLSSQTLSTSTLNAPLLSSTKTQGRGDKRSAELTSNGQGDYRNETLLTNSRDVSFLSNLIQTLFFLRGIDVVPPDEADTDVFVIVDVFGTIRSRTELHILNAETLKALTKLEYFAVDKNTRQLVIKPTTSAFEATYQEQYALWAGPFKVNKDIKPSDRLLVDFSDITPYAKTASISSGEINWQEPDIYDVEPNTSRHQNEKE